MRIFYVHGIGSAGGGNTVDMIKKYFPNDEIYSPDIPVSPIEAFEFIKKESKDYDLIIGTSLGGFYTMMVSGKFKILINPAINADTEIPSSIGMGEHEFLRERASGETTYTVDETFVKELSFLKERFFKEWFDYEYKSETYGIFGTEDTVVNDREEFKKTWWKRNYHEDVFGHRMTEDVFIKTVKPIIETIRKAVS